METGDNETPASNGKVVGTAVGGLHEHAQPLAEAHAGYIGTMRGCDPPNCRPPIDRRRFLGLAAAGVMGARVDLRDFSGLDPSGNNDNTSQLQTAIDQAASSSSPVVTVPAGDYLVGGTLKIGNGTPSRVSSTSGVRVIGALPPGIANPYPTTLRSTKVTRLISGSAVSMIQINGPLMGWGLENVILDGNSIGTTGLDERACWYGGCANLCIQGFTHAAQGLTAYPMGAYPGGYAPSCHAYNTYRNVSIQVPDVNNDVGILVWGNNDDGTSDCYYDVWDNASVAIGSVGGGKQIIAIYLRGCDNETFRRIATPTWTAPVGRAIMVTFDYSAKTPSGVGGWPSDCRFENVDWGNATRTFTNQGAPNALATFNRVYNMSATNGRPANPGLANLQWGWAAQTN